jgi:hypothetical protein
VDPIKKTNENQSRVVFQFHGILELPGATSPQVEKVWVPETEGVMVYQMLRLIDPPAQLTLGSTEDV